MAMAENGEGGISSERARDAEVQLQGQWRDEQEGEGGEQGEGWWA
jgi:hypothetical protein